MKLQHAGQTVQVLGSAAPLGRALLGKVPGDQISVPLAGAAQDFEVLSVE